MRHAMANRRRNRQNGGGGGSSNNGGHRPQHNKATVFDSNGPDVRIRGTAFQIVEKYMALAKDSASSGDRVLAENYLQHAEHYQRLISSWVEEAPQQRYYNNDSAVAENNTDDDASEPSVVVTRPVQQPRAEEDDLGLPASILGGSAQGQQQGGQADGNTRNPRVAVAG